MTSTFAPSIDFTAIDVETANSSRASVCAVGLTKVRDRQVVDTASWLVAPPEGHDVFMPRNVAIHSITAEQVADAPSWDTVFPQMMEFVGTDALVAHNAPFDRSVVHQACSAYDLDWPGIHVDRHPSARAEDADARLSILPAVRRPGARSCGDRPP